MTTLREVLGQADRTRVAVGHFNVSDLAALRAVIEAARELGAPVLIGVSEGEREFMGVRQAAALVESLRDEYGHPVFLNADHTHSIERAEEAARAGFDEVIFDASALPLEQNILETRRAVVALRSIRDGVVVEGEIGWIGASSEIHEKAPDDLELTTPDEARQFVEETGVDVLAPAVGNAHGLTEGMLKTGAEKRLDLPRIEAIKLAAQTFMTLHGASGTNATDLLSAIRAGMTIVHVNTEIRLAWRRGLEQALRSDPREVAPYKILPGALAAVKEVVRGRLALFNQREQAGVGPARPSTLH